MKTVIRGGMIHSGSGFNNNAELILDSGCSCGGERLVELGEACILPAFCDVHVHFREPGFEYKETIASGSKAAARGGYSVVATMPNLNPVPHDLASLGAQLDIIKRDSVVTTIPYGAITMNQSGRGALADMEAMAPYVIAFSDDGKGMQDGVEMKEAMQVAKSLGKMIVAHCEDESLLAEGKVRESEWRQIERDLNLAYETGVAYHVCHISCEESVKVIREAKKSGVNVTCETAPHYLLLDTDDLSREINANPAIGGKFKMNPPIKDAADRRALIEGCLDGTVDMIATDHAPHSAEEKAKGFAGSANGIVGLECAFPTLYTGLVKEGIVPFDRLIEMMAYAPKKRFGICDDNSYVIMDLNNEYTINPEEFATMGRSTPFDGWKVYGKTLMTIVNGRVVYDNLEVQNG